MKRVRPIDPSKHAVAHREEVVERSSAEDARRDPGATAKISREVLREALGRVGSGTHAAVCPVEPLPETSGPSGPPRTISGERVAVRPEPVDPAPVDERPTARPPGSATIEMGADEASSNRLADEMLRAVEQARRSGPIQTAAAVAVHDVAPSAPPLSVDAVTVDALTPEVAAARAELDRRLRNTRIAVAVIVGTIILAGLSWYAGRVVGALLHSS